MCIFCGIGKMADLMWQAHKGEAAILAEIFNEVCDDLEKEADTANDPMADHEFNVAWCMACRMYADSYGHHKVYDA